MEQGEVDTNARSVLVADRVQGETTERYKKVQQIPRKVLVHRNRLSSWDLSSLIKL